MRTTLVAWVVAAVVSFGVATAPAGAATLALVDGMEFTVDDIVTDAFFVPFQSVPQSVSYSLPAGMEAVSANIDGIACQFASGQEIGCLLPANFGGQVHVQMRATEALFQEDIFRYFVTVGGLQTASFTVSAGAPLATVASFSAEDCRAIDTLATGFGISASDVLVRSSAFWLTVPFAFPLPLPEPASADCEIAVVVPADQAVVVLGYSRFTRQSPDGWVTLSGQLIAEVLRALVRLGA